MEKMRLIVANGFRSHFAQPVSVRVEQHRNKKRNMAERRKK